jgi:hypothetical protein
MAETMASTMPSVLLPAARAPRAGSTSLRVVAALRGMAGEG